jgi:hypothetical protein
MNLKNLLWISAIFSFSLGFTVLSIFGSENNDPIVQEIFAQARLYTKQELAQSETPERIEALLYREEQDVYDAMRKQCEEDKCYLYHDNRDLWCDDRDWDKMLHGMVEFVEFKTSGVKRPQDEATVGERLIHFTRKYLRQSGMNPDNVTIAGNKDYFDANPDTVGYAEGCLVPDNMANPKIVFNMNSSMIQDFPHYVSAHEVTHLKEKHRLKKHLYHNYYPYHLFPEPVAKKFEDSFRALTRVHEKQASLFPLLRFNDRCIHKEMLDEIMPDCIKQYKSGTLNEQWHKSKTDDTHPRCSELLPYALHIEKVKMTNQKKKSASLV